MTGLPQPRPAASCAPAPGHRAGRARARRERRSALIIALVTLFPIFWMVSTAFKPSQEIYSLTPSLLPAHPTLGNFARSSAGRRPGSARSGCSSATACP